MRGTGIGIPPAVRAKLFEPFSQGDVSTTRRFGGTGLGLTISRGLMALVGGNIQIDSVPGQGTRFRVTLPVDPSDPSPQGSVSASLRLQGRRVLILESPPKTGQVICQYLQAWGRCPI